MITDLKRRALHRTKILQGQLKGLEKMIVSEEYCMDIITQSLAIQKSLSSLNRLILENHIRTHVQEMLSSDSPERQDQAAKELLQLYTLANIKGSPNEEHHCSH